MSEPCGCTEPGYCPRHKMTKGPNNFRLCQNREEYRELWDNNVREAVTEEFTLIEKAKAFKESAVVNIQNGAKRTSKEEKQARMDICNSCDKRQDNICKVCGCFLTLKTTWKSSECPLGKWPILE